MLSNRVSAIMTKDLTSTDASSTVFETMLIMVAKNVGRIIIMQNQKPLGIFTEKDVLRRVMNKKADPKKTSVRTVMTSPVETVAVEAHLGEALEKMYKGGFRHLLVGGENGMIVGMVSMRGILKLAVEVGRGGGEARTIGSIMSANFLTVDGTQSIYDTIALMIKKNTGCVVVSSEAEPKGIFTERDVLKRVAVKDIDSKKTPIRDVMTANLVSMPRAALVEEVLAKMFKGGFRHVPILGDKGELAGNVSMRDVLKYARALDIDESVRKAWKEVEAFWDSEEHYTPG